MYQKQLLLSKLPLKRTKLLRRDSEFVLYIYLHKFISMSSLNGQLKREHYKRINKN